MVLVTGLTIAFTAAKFIFKPKEITQITAKGEKKEIYLEDGSVIVLNSNSSVTYHEEFETIRNKQLTGQAYFKVFRDVKRLFIVQTHDVKVRVLGTSFDINSYNHHGTKVSVITGKVEVSSPAGNKVQITKNQQADLIKTPISGFLQKTAMIKLHGSAIPSYLKTLNFLKPLKILDGSGMPMPGVTVLEKGTKTSTMTDMEGNFSFAVNSSAVLVISYMGYNSQEVAASANPITVIMKLSTSELNEVQAAVV